MGVDYTAYTIIGSRVSRAALYRLEQRQVCEHVIPEQFAYCPECGQQRLVTVKTPLYDERSETINGLQVILIAETEDAYIAQWYRKTDMYDEPARAFVPNQEHAMKSVQVALEPLGLWDEQQFGLWTVLEAS